jgi:hypothetical protein
MLKIEKGKLQLKKSKLQLIKLNLLLKVKDLEKRGIDVKEESLRLSRICDNI